MTFQLTGDASTNPNALPYVEFVAMIALLMALNAAAIDVYIPALQDIGSALGVADENRRQFVITAYVVGFGGAQIFYGPLSDRFGRRPVLFAGLGIYLTGAIAAIFVPTFETLLLTRLVQGIGAAATRVIATSVVRDRFQGAQMASVMSLVMMVFMVMPVVAPNIGSAVLAFGTWRELSGFMFFFGLAALIWSWARLPETLRPEDRRDLRIKPVAEAFRIVLTNRIAFCYTLAMASFFGALFAFIGQAEQIYTGIYNIGPHFTIYFSLVAVFMAASSFANSRLVARYGAKRLSHTALLGFIAVAFVHLLLAIAYGGATPFWMYLTLFIGMMCFFGFVPTNFNAMAMEPLGRVAGVASSVLGCAQTLGGGLLGGAIGYLYNGTLIPLLAGFVSLALISLCCVLVAEKGRLFGN